MRKHKFGFILSHCILPLLNVGMAHAEIISERDTVTVLRNVEVSTTAAPKQIASTAPISQLSEEDLAREGVTNVADAVHRLPGVTLRDYGGAGGLKTVSVRGFGAAHTGVVYDGIPLSDAQSGQIDLQRYSVDNVGSLSLVVGDNDDLLMPARATASCASLSISSVSPSFTPALTARLRGGSWGFINPFLKAGAPIGKKNYLEALGEYSHAKNDYPFTLQNGSTETRERRNNSRINSYHTELNWNSQLSQNASLKTKVYYYYNTRRLPGPVIYYNNTAHESLKERNAFAQSILRVSLTQQLSLMAIAKFNYSYSGYLDIDGKYPNGRLDQRYWQREWYASSALLWTPTKEYAMTYAADYAFNNLTSNLLSNTSPRRHSILQTLTGRYRNQHITAMGRLLLSVYDNSSKTGQSAKDATRLSPSASISVKPWLDHNLFFRLSHKNIFRMPTFNEAYFDHYGSADVLPETTNQINFGTTYNFSSGRLTTLSITADSYINHINDMIVAVPYNMFVWRITNLGSVRVIGADVTLNVDLEVANFHTLSLNANYSYQRAQPRTDPTSSDWMKQVAYIPLNSGYASLSWENPWVNCSLHATGMSARYTTNNNLPATRIEGHIEMGARLWRDLYWNKHKIELKLDLLNIFDKQYQIVARYPMPGRSWQATIGFQI